MMLHFFSFFFLFQGAHDVTPIKRSQTVSRGDSVTLSVDTDASVQNELRWRHNGSDPLTHDTGVYKESKTLTISNVEVVDGGIYECHENHERNNGRQAIMLLVVRGM